MYYCIILTILTTGNPVRPFCGKVESLYKHQYYYYFFFWKFTSYVLREYFLGSLHLKKEKNLTTDKS